ncbi:unnamed protein product, partial [Rotaria magnacalcarata]
MPSPLPTAPRPSCS